jgi:cytoskeletal protein CcmA (bactofilin family)
MFGLKRLFSSSESASETPSESPKLTIISTGTTVWGTITLGSVDLRVEGNIHGDVATSGRVYVAPDAEVYGNVQAASIRVAGLVEGDLEARETLLLQDDSTVRGSLQADVLKIDPGAQFRGSVHDAEAGVEPAERSPSGDSAPSFLSSSPPEPASPPRPAVEAPAREMVPSESANGSAPATDDDTSTSTTDASTPSSSDATTSDAPSAPSSSDSSDADTSSASARPSTPSSTSSEENDEGDDSERYGFRW